MGCGATGTARGEVGPAAARVAPRVALPSPYRLPAGQLQRRKAPPPGQAKYTAKRVEDAIAAICRGEKPERIKRRKTLLAAEEAAAAELDDAPMGDAESESGEDDAEDESGEESGEDGVSE